jgi:hypothetical protein
MPVFALLSPYFLAQILIFLQKPAYSLRVGPQTALGSPKPVPRVFAKSVVSCLVPFAAFFGLFWSPTEGFSFLAYLRNFCLLQTA